MELRKATEAITRVLAAGIDCDGRCASYEGRPIRSFDSRGDLAGVANQQER